ncbi:hypothetical protein AB1Y20_019761 [Prymnesium parvum]|uniref:Thiopurine S-methyltransferase n=1 Tax=Prymnesium parvum TaxID=97485 RepID=A0AB34JVV2_PRYPA
MRRAVATGAAAASFLLWQQADSGAGVASASSGRSPRRDGAQPSQPDGQPAKVDRMLRWREKWEAGVTRWHLSYPHPLLKQYDVELLGPVVGREAQSILLPLCGKSVDLGYLARRGHDVVGVEGVGLAIDALLRDWGEELTVPRPHWISEESRPSSIRVRMGRAGWYQKMASEQLGKTETGTPYTTAELLRVVEGDFLQLSPQMLADFGLGTFDAAFDRGALVAVNPADRPQYAEVLTSLICPGGKVLLVAVEHEPFFGPPFSLTHEQVTTLFSDHFEVQLLQREDTLDKEPSWRERGATKFEEVAYLLTKR